MTDQKDIELEKIRKGFGEVFTPQEEVLTSVLVALDLPKELLEKIVGEFAFQTSSFEVIFYIFVKEGDETLKDEPLTSLKARKFKFTRFTSVREAVIEALKIAWIENWFKIEWKPYNASVYLMPGLEDDLAKLKDSKPLYEDGIFKIRGEEKLINILDRPLANGKIDTTSLFNKEPVEF